MNVLFGEEDVDAFERSIVGRHTIKLQARYGLHTFFGHILLREDGGQLLGAVVAIIEENNDIVGLNASVDLGVNQRLHKFICVLVLFGRAVVAALHSCYHIRFLTSFAMNEVVVSNLQSVPALIAVHRVETADDRSHVCALLVAFLFELFDKAFAAARIRIAAVHKAVDVSFTADAVSTGYVDELE